MKRVRNKWKMMTAMARLPCKQQSSSTPTSQQHQSRHNNNNNNSNHFNEGRAYWGMQPTSRQPVPPPYVRNPSRQHADNTGESIIPFFYFFLFQKISCFSALYVTKVHFYQKQNYAKNYVKKQTLKILLRDYCQDLILKSNISIIL